MDKTFPLKGMSGVLYLLLKFVLLAILFALGISWFAPSGSAVTQELQFFTHGFLEGLGVRAVIAVGYIIIQSLLVFEHALSTPLFRWPWAKNPTLRDQFEAEDNDSHAIVMLGIVVSGILLATMITASTWQIYVFIILTRGLVGELFGDLSTFIVARAFGVRSMDKFRDWVVSTKRNDSHAILVSVIKCGWLALALSVH